MTTRNRPPARGFPPTAIGTWTCPRWRHASSGYLSGQFDASGHRMNLTLRVTASGARVRDAAFPDERETGDLVLRTMRRPAKVGE